MSHTYASNRVHVVFSTRDGEKNLANDLQPKLWGYMKGIAKNHGFEVVKIGGASDHVHALLVVPPAMPLAKAVQPIKGCSSKWLNDTGAAGMNFAWQEGYGAFSVSASQTDTSSHTSRIRPRIMPGGIMRKSLSSCCGDTAFLTIRRTCWVRAGPSLRDLISIWLCTQRRGAGLR